MLGSLFQQSCKFQACNSLKRGLRGRYCPANLVKCFKTVFLWNANINITASEHPVVSQNKNFKAIFQKTAVCFRKKRSFMVLMMEHIRRRDILLAYPIEGFSVNSVT